MRIELDGELADAFGSHLADWWCQHYRLEDKGRPGWVSFAELKKAVTGCEFAGGKGDSPESPVRILNAPTPVISEFAEVLFLCHWFGKPDIDWSLENRVFDPDFRPGLERVLVMLPDFGMRTVWFDISEVGPKADNEQETD
ncbi:MAG: hypothetical protein JSU73_03870 [candidate division WOR-3 bacterium]|nr:MAG: hypothetical protein JSU73_03870 [candidate division WOR-3 bacterium]